MQIQGKEYEIIVEVSEKIGRLKTTQKTEHGAFSVNTGKKRKLWARRHCNKSDRKPEIRRHNPNLAKGRGQIATPLYG